MIEVSDVVKTYRVHVRQPGFASAVRSLFNRSFRDVRAVDGISFRIGQGEIVGFLGPNGAGKTTTMKLLTGLIHPTSGRLDVAGYVPQKHEKAFKKRISLVMGQKSQLVWDIPASETFLVNKEIYEIPDREYKRTLDMFVELLRLSEVID